MIQLNYKKNILYINNKDVVCPQKIIKVFELKDLIIVFLDPDAETNKKMKYKNLMAYNINGELVWKAELPESNMINDAYWKVYSSYPLRANSFSSYECEIDINTGKILKATFYK
ncbi:MAG: hypothetical protein ACRENO_03800 [Thermodesulfobacteriota bacterium]